MHTKRRAAGILVPRRFAVCFITQKENNIQMKNKIEEKAERAIAIADKLPRSDVG
ncbi:MAG: hypothetical protein WBE34_07880 [Candidatus Nitrosopolaris sp.]